MKFLVIIFLMTCKAYTIESLDATVIYRLSDIDTKITDPYIEVPKGEVHVRTNALGLFPQAIFYDRLNDNNEHYFPDCISYIDSCDWEKVGWRNTSSSSYYATFSTDNDSCKKNKSSECHHIKYNKDNVHVLEISRYSQESKIINIIDAGYTIFELNNTNHKTCHNIKVRIFEVRERYSSGREIMTNSNYNQKTFRVSPKFKKIQLYVANNCPTIQKILYYTDPMNMTAYELSERVGYMKSPAFITQADILCIGLSYDIKDMDNNNKLQIDVRLLKRDGTYKTMNENRTYNHKTSFYKRFFLKLDEDDKGVPLSVKVEVKVTEDLELSTFHMKRIEKCDLENMEQIILLNKTYIPLRYFNTSRNVTTDQVCINGGVWNGEEKICNCPAGFTGKNCEIGCGENKYGDDCSGRCLAFVDKCKGLLMCKYGLPCHCAPGFKGQFCNISCDEGEYGADCNVKCGHCLDGTSCDPYTGACNSGCEEGYYPPLCYYRYKHLTSPPIVSSSAYNTLTVMTDFENTTGVSTPKYYEIQYKEKSQNSWLKSETKLIPEESNNDTVYITGLKPGMWYYVRAVLIDKYLNSYQEDDIPVALAQTLCLVSNDIDYKLQSQEVSQNTFQITWQYNPDKSTTCPFHVFEVYVKEQWRWFLFWNGTDSQTTLKNLLHGNMFYVKMRAVTINGPAQFSNIISVTTKIIEPGAVTDIQILVFEPQRIGLVWTPPNFPEGTISSYTVKYQCKKLLGCPEADCSHIKGEFSILMPKATISGLLPHSQYIVSISALSESDGPEVVTTVATDQAVPGVAPSAASKQVSHRTNTSFTVSWMAPLNCRAMNGFFSHFEYQLLETTDEHIESQYPILEGSTRNTSVTFTALKSHSTYIVKIYVATSAGVNTSNPLIITADTKAGVPEKIENLTVYKKGRKVIGVRWGLPKSVNGKLHSISISYQKKGSSDVIYKEIKPMHCSAWQHLYCYTITGLSADTEYIVSVSARNSEIGEDGDSSIVNVITREEAPGTPAHLKVSNQTETSITVQWKLPHLLNGVLRSFLITIEQTDSHNSSDCCQDFPFQTLSATHEQPYYSYEFTDLRPASTYTISVSARTTLIGPSTVAIGYTKPPKPNLEGAITIASDVSFESGILLELAPVEQYEDLIRKGLLILLPQNDSIVLETIHEPEITEESLINELLDTIEEPFYFIAELPQNVLHERSEIFLSTTATSKNALHFHIEEQLIVSGAKYRLGLVLVLQYCDVYNLAYTITPEFLVN